MKKLRSLIFTVCLTAASQCMASQTSVALNGTWFGTLVLSNASGRVAHDTAVLVIEQSRSGLSGGMGRTIDQLTPWTGGSFSDGRLQFLLAVADGLTVTLTMNRDHNFTGIATGRTMHAIIDLKPAPGLLPHEQLQKEIEAVDQKLYTAFDHCDSAAYASYLDKDLEFFQDHTGETGYEQNVKALQDRCAEGIQLRRQLEPDSLIVNAAPGFGAIQAGTQRFYSRNKDGQEHLDATARFTNIWSKKGGSWKLVRIISYDHR
jgi:ketosteroid isomerase-like protein